MENSSRTVPFDPGYSKFVSSFLFFNEQAMGMVNSLKVLQQRAFKYRQLLPQILQVFKTEVGFYYGCLLWAVYISSSPEPKEISDNSFYGRTKEDLEKFDYLQEVNYVLNFFDKYPKNLAYYKIQGAPLEEKYLKTVEIYKEFLTINESFINTKTTADIKLPPSVRELPKQELEKAKALIDLTVEDGNFDRLFEVELFV